MKALHMALLPGDGNPWHSRIVIIGEDGIGDGVELGWNPNPGPADTVSCGPWPYPSPFMQQLSTSWSPAIDLHCTGHAQLATGPTLLTTGGDDHSLNWGVPDALSFTPGSSGNPGTWSARDDMHQPRFYPTPTALCDGRMLVTGGLREVQDWHFGGRVNGNAPTGGAGNLLHRLGRGKKRIWDFPFTPTALPETNRPTAREGHTAVSLIYAAGDNRQAIFGGKDFSDTTSDQDVYLLRRQYGAELDNDYKYDWLKLSVSGEKPPARSDHVAINLNGIAEMLIFGGLSNPSGGPAVVRDDVWRLYKVDQTWFWQQKFPSGTGPGPRFGHAAVKDGTKMYVFGGAASASDTLADNNVYKLTLPDGPWEIVQTSGTPPASRRDHIMVLAGTSLLVHGGYSGAGPSDGELWRLDLSASTPQWSVVSTEGPSPGPRANHSARFDNIQDPDRLTIFGGVPPTTSDPAVDSHLYYINHPFPTTGDPTWTKGPDTGYKLSGHTVDGDPSGGILHAHLPEIYDPDDDSWTPQTGSGWFPPIGLEGEYPVQFLVPGTSIPGGGGRLLRVGPDPITRYLDIPASGIAGSWVTAPNGSNGSYFPLTGVQYQPGKILVIGAGPGQGAPDAHARSFDALAVGTASWQDRSDGKEPHQDPNILMLPNGKVLVVGDCTQIWDPLGNGGAGTWTDCLAPEIFYRTYHSTALLLPDARVLSAGGDDEVPNVYCPPYLFSGESLAPRPTITSAPESVVYGEAFVIGKPTSDQIASACLIRPGAVTHAVDQNGRYVPLTFAPVNDTTLRIWAPLDGSIAPPGDYMLFILNTSGVPAVARWIHIGDCATTPCDAVSPPAVTDLYADIVGPSEIWMAWTAPGDDRTPLSGVYDLRLPAVGPADDADYDAATPVSGEPGVQPFGTPISCVVDSLAECTQYHFALKTRDGSSPSFKNWSLLSNTVTVTTTCGGGPSGGSRAERVDESRQAAEVSAAAGRSSDEAAAATGAGSLAGSAAAGLASLESGAGAIEVETRRTREGWQVTLRRVDEAAGIEAADADAIVSQVQATDGGWRTLGRFRPATPGPLGLCALRDQGRIVFPAGYGVERVASGLKSRGERSVLASANHSRTGAMDGGFVSEGGAVELTLGDVLTLTYDQSGTSPANEVGVYLTLRPAGLGASSASTSGRRFVPTLPVRYALHANQPNPFGQSTTIGFDLPVPGPVRLEVFDLLGRRVATVAEGEYPAGRHAVQWNLRDGDGPVRPGVYWYRLQSREFSARRKLSVVP